MFLQSKDEKVFLREVRESDAIIDSNYYEWMNDPEVTKYLESRYTPWSQDRLQEYVRRMNADPNTAFLAITNINELHMGNVKLVINSQRHRFAEISIVIGKLFQGRHVGTTALTLVKDYAFTTLGLHKVWAGILSPHTASIATFKKAGFQEEARLDSQYLVDNEWVSDVIMSAWNPAHKL